MLKTDIISFIEKIDATAHNTQKRQHTQVFTYYAIRLPEIVAQAARRYAAEHHIYGRAPTFEYNIPLLPHFWTGMYNTTAIKSAPFSVSLNKTWYRPQSRAIIVDILSNELSDIHEKLAKKFSRKSSGGRNLATHPQLGHNYSFNFKLVKDVDVPPQQILQFEQFRWTVEEVVRYTRQEDKHWKVTDVIHLQ